MAESREKWTAGPKSGLLSILDAVFGTAHATQRLSGLEKIMTLVSLKDLSVQPTKNSNVCRPLEIAQLVPVLFILLSASTYHQRSIAVLSPRVLFTAVLVYCSAIATPVQAQLQESAKLAWGAATSPVGKFVIAHIGSKFLDSVWDPTSGEPDIELLNQRLLELEKNAAVKSELQASIKAFRLQLDSHVTRDEFERKLGDLHVELAAIHVRLEDLEIKSEITEVRLADLENENRPPHASDPLHFVQRGNEFLHQHQGTRAIANFNAALRVDPSFEPAYLARANYHLSKDAVEVAQIDYDHVISLDGRCRDAHIGKATTSMILGEFSALADHAEIVVSDYPKDFDGLFLLGQAHLNHKKYAEALQCFEDCIEMKPEAALALNGKALALWYSEEYQSAETAFSKALQHEPLQFIRCNRANLRADRGHIEDALVDFDQVLSHRVRRPTFQRGETALGPVASLYYLRHRNADGTKADVGYEYGRRGLLHGQVGRMEKSASDLRKCIELGAANGWHHVALGNALLHQGALRDALKELNRGIDMGVHDSTHWFAYSCRGETNFRLGNMEEAAADIAIALESPNSNATEEWLGKFNWFGFAANETIGNGNAAFEHLQAAVEHQPDLAEKLECGFIKVVNSTNRDIDFCPDFWIDERGSKVDVNNSWWSDGSTTFWRIKAGEEALLQYQGERFRTSKISYWIEKTGSHDYGSTWTATWTIAGSPINRLVIGNKHLPD